MRVVAGDQRNGLGSAAPSLTVSAIHAAFMRAQSATAQQLSGLSHSLFQRTITSKL